ncbi:DMT family transporter [Adlercreutzia sp. ZJ473]|uniref:DMT family transporter n=1 Tax=Adlercreutzia sp. ZJ473 TaxID=2722822 RepID=UPI001554A587|nr:DMT family transporter [Adlercreutzia sp. ZJ473]
MNAKRNIPAIVYKLMIVVATVIWGFSFVVMKDAVSVLEPAWLIGVRFALTAAVLTAVFFRHLRAALTREYLVAGGILGALNFLAFWTQTIGLAHTTPGKNAFLTATYCVIVPFVFWLIAKKRPTSFNLVAAVMCVAGVGMVSLSSGALTVEFGDFMTLVCAVFFAVHIACVAKFAQGRDVLALTVYQFWVGGICGVAIGALTEAPPNVAALSPEFLFNLFYLVIFASCVALVFQNVALAHVPPAQGSLLLSLESVFGVLFSVLLYGEQMTPRLLAGFALIFGAIVVSEVLPEKFGKRKDEPAALEDAEPAKE